MATWWILRITRCARTTPLREWIDPRRNRIALHVCTLRFNGYLSGRVDFLGGIATDISGARDFAHAINRVGGMQGLLRTPNISGETEFGFMGHILKGPIDSATYGAILADRWKWHAFGEFDLYQFPQSL